MSRVACARCGQWMFHLAKVCPHCGAAIGEPAAPKAAAAPVVEKKKLELSPEEARALLTASVPHASEPKLRDVGAELVLPRGGGLDLVLTLLAVPVTALTVVVLGYAVLQALRKKLPVEMRRARMLAVPTTAGLAGVLLYEVGAPVAAWVGLAVSLAAWVLRDVVRARRRPDPLD